MLSKNIRNLRESLGFTQAQVASYLGVSTAAVNQYENDARTIPTEVVSKIALLFSVRCYSFL